MSRYSILFIVFILLLVVCLVSHLSYTSSRVVSNSHLSRSLVYVTTREGLSSRFGQIERIHSHALSYNRTVVVVDNTCVHYKDVGSISMCEIFAFPYTITCISDSIQSVVEKFRCTMPYLNSNKSEDHKWLLKPSNFGLPSFQDVHKGQFHWNSTKCSLLFGYYFTLDQPEVNTLRIAFQSRYEKLYHTSLTVLKLGNSKVESELVVFHWRRGDQADRCKRNQDKGINCGSVQEFIAQVNQTCVELECKNRLVYVATNENNPANLRALRKQGYRTAQDIKTGQLASVNSLELFTIELQLMIAARDFVGWGTTGVRHFVNTARRQRQKRVIPLPKD